MKKLISSMFMMAAISASMLITSCGDKTDDPAKVYNAPTLVLNDGVAKSSGSLSLFSFPIKIVASADVERKINKITITRAVTGQSTLTTFDKTYDTKDVVLNLVDTLGGGAIVFDEGDDITYNVKVVDDLGKTTTGSVVLNISSMVTSKQIYLGASNCTINEYRFLGTQDDFRSYRAGSLGSDLAKENSSKIDFVYFFSTSGSVQNALYSPDYPFAAGEGWNAEIANWPSKNTTQYKLTTLTSSYFDGLVGSTFMTELATLDFTTGTQNRVANLQVGQVVAFMKKSDGKRGFIKIGNTTTTATGQMLIVVKAEL